MRQALVASMNFTKDPEVAWAIDDLFSKLVDFYSASHLETPSQEEKPRSLWTSLEVLAQEEAHMDVTTSLHALLRLLSQD